MSGWTVYIVRCADGKYFAGVTTALAACLEEHNGGRSPHAYTARRRPVVLVFREEFASAAQARFAERRINGWSRRKKEALIRGKWRVRAQLTARRRDDLEPEIERPL